MAEVTVTLPRLRETKGTVLFGYEWQDQSKPRDLATTNVYLKKSAVQELGNPDKIVIVVKAG